MIVNKCDNCGMMYEDGAFPGWLQITADNGILIVSADRQATKYRMLDFCCNNCASDFLLKLGQKFKESACQLKSEE